MGVDAHLIEELRPKFTADDLKALEAFGHFNAKYYTVIRDKLRLYLSKDPFLDPIFYRQENHEQSNNLYQLQQNAIYKGEWEEFIRHLIEEGTAFARAGLQMKDWFYVFKTYKDIAHAHILKEFPADLNQAGMVWSGLNKLIDFALSIESQSYIIEKNTLIIAEQDRKEQALKELKESEERFRALYNNSSDRIFMVDEEGTIQYINHIPKGRKKESVIGSNFLDYQAEKDKPKVVAALKKVFKTGKTAVYEAESIFTGEDRVFSGSVAPMFKDGTAYGAAIIARDITERKEKEQEIQELNETLEEKVQERTLALQNEIEERKLIEEQVIELNAQLEKKLHQLHATNQELESFSYTVSHDLRAPLRAIDGFSKVLLKKLDGKLDSAQTHYLGVIIENVGKMGMLIDDLLAFSRMGRLAKKETTFDMEQLVRSVFKDLMQSEDEDHISLTMHPLPNTKADRDMMKHVIGNLLNNAIKFSSGKAEVKIEVGARTGKKEVTYYIKDNGVGFEMEYVDKLFGIFQRLHSDDEFEGTGVGLAIVQRIIHRHHGRVWAESALNEGATFYFSLPK